MSSTKSKAAKEAEAVIETAADTDITETSAGATTIESSGEGFGVTLHVTNEGVEKTTKVLETSQARLTKILGKTAKSSEEILAFSQGNLEAVIKATQIYATGFDDISKQLTASSKASFDGSVAFANSLIGVKSGKEAFDLQTAFIKASIKNAATERKKVIEAITKLAEQAITPLSTRFALTLETLGKPY